MKAPRRDVKVARDDGDVPLLCLARFATIDASARCAVAYLLFAVCAQFKRGNERLDGLGREHVPITLYRGPLTGRH